MELFYCIREMAKIRIRKFPYFYHYFLMIKYHNRPFSNRIVGASTELVVEGFPRSANSFTARFFRRNNDGIVIATHSHSPTEIIVAAKRTLPIIVLLRNPKDAILSFVVFDIIEGRLKNGNASVF